MSKENVPKEERDKTEKRWNVQKKRTDPRERERERNSVITPLIQMSIPGHN